MALKNRTEAQGVVTAWAPILDLEAVHKPDLRDEILDNCLFRKDVSTSTAASGTTKTVEFLDVDYIEVTQSNNVAYTLNNVQQGEIKYLKITKTANQTVSFANAENQAFDQGHLDTLTEVFYTIINKDGSLLAIPLTLAIDIATEAEARAIVNDTKVMTPLKVSDITKDTIWSEFEIGDWNMDGVISLSVSIGSIAPDDVREVSVIIRIDDDDALAPRTYNLEQDGNYFVRSGSLITLTRNTSGFFDSTSFDKTSFNRGWVSIRHKV